MNLGMVVVVVIKLLVGAVVAGLVYLSEPVITHMSTATLVALGCGLLAAYLFPVYVEHANEESPSLLPQDTRDGEK